MSGAARTGGCACGAVRYRIAGAVTDPGWCHCRICQLQSGSPAMAFATASLADFAITDGADAIGRFDSSTSGHRLFCTRCGTPLLMQDNDGATSVDFSLATLDEPGEFAPAFHIFYTSRIPWAPAADDAPQYARGRKEGILL